MFVTICRFEIKQWLKSWSFYIYFFAVYLLALLSMAGASGVFGENASLINIANAPLGIYGFINFFNKLLLIILPAIVGGTIYKDFKSNFHSILYTYPFSKTNYLFAKFISAFCIVLLIALAVVGGLITGTILPTANPAQLLPFNAAPYLYTFCWITIPNLFLLSVVVFAVVLFSRNIYTGFIAVVLFWLLKEIAVRIMGGFTEGMASIIVDPFAESTVQYYTRYRTQAEQRMSQLPHEPIIIVNRLLWLCVALIIFYISYRSFSFSQSAVSIGLKRKRDERSVKTNVGTIIKIDLPDTTFDFSFWHHLKTSMKLAWVDFGFITKSSAFISIVVAGAVFIMALLLQMNSQTDTRILPVTWVILGFPVFFFSFLIQFLTFLYAGILVHRASTANFAQLIAVTPVSNWVLLLSKWLALVKVQVLLLLIIMVSGIAVQVGSGYYQVEIGHYLFDLFVIHLISFMIWAFLSILIQTVITNTYLGLFVLILLLLGITQLPAVGIKSYLLRFNDTPNSNFFLYYSDISGYGQSLKPYFLFKTYWLLLGIVFFEIATLFWQRQQTNGFVERLVIVRKGISGNTAAALLVSLIAFISFGFYLFRLEQLPENTILSGQNEQALLTQFQYKYGKLEQIKQPRITSAFVQLDIFPETNSFIARGNYTLINKTTIPIDTLMIKTGYDEISTLSFNTSATLVSKDDTFKFAVYTLQKPLAPGDSIKLLYTVRNRANTLLVQNSNVLKNGTYLKNDILPQVGYFANTDKKHPGESTAFHNHYQSINSDLINFEAVLSTSPKQIAITAGTLQKEWMENHRRYFHYKMETPIKFVVGFQSGEFAKAEETYKGIDLKIYYHPQHTYNLQQMIEGLKAGLNYNAANFGAYQHKQAKIIEFPRQIGSYATTSGNCIQISETRCINDPGKTVKGGIDLSFYVAAHELTHQWWGNQVIPADALGATMITESITEYISAKIYEKKYGRQHALKFLDIQLSRYLAGRANESGREPPLYLVNPEQSYIAYGKGSIALYTLSEYIGEDTLNKSLNAFLDKVKFQHPPYTTTLELLDYLKQATPASLQYLIVDLFEGTDKEKLLFHFNKMRKAG